MKSLLLLHCYLFLIGYAWAANDGGCAITEIANEDYLTAYLLSVEDIQIDIELKELPFTGTLAVESCDNPKYFEISATATRFIIRTTAAFRDFDQDTPKQNRTFVISNIQCRLRCDNGISVLPIQITVNDVNTHPPFFDKVNYEYKVATPIMPLTDFSVYGDSPITATDIDFSNQNVVFTVEPNDFAITTISDATTKDYVAVFAARSVIQLVGSRSYTVTATDSGDPPLNSQTTLTLTVDESKSLDTPSFESASYSFNYTVNGTSAHLVPLDDPITVITNKPASLSDPTLIGDLAGYFDVSLDKTTSTLDLSLKGDSLLPTDTGSFVILSLSVSTDNRATAPLIVHTPQSDETPQFSSHFYTGYYIDLTNTVILDNPIEILSSRVPDISLLGEYAQHFKAEYDEKTKTCEISIDSALSVAQIKSHSYVNLGIKATIGDNYDTAAIILSLPDHQLQFTKGLYTAKYNSDNTLTFDDGDTITFTTDVLGVDIGISGTYSESFSIKQTTGTNEWSLLVNTPIAADVIRSEKEIVIKLRATDAYDNEATSVVNIQLPVVPTDAPLFSRAYYSANYVAGDLPTITLNEAVAIINRDDQSNLKITLDSFTDNFNVVYNEATSSWLLVILSPLTEDTLLTRNEIIVTITAEEKDNPDKGEAAIVIGWEKKEIPRFSQGYFVGTYPEDGKGTIEVSPPISFTNGDNLVDITITLDNYKDNFGITHSGDNWLVTIKQKLSEDILTTHEELVIGLTATEPDVKDESYAVLIIKLPTVKEAPRFSRNYYVGKYPDTGTGTIELSPSISFQNVEDPTNVEITLDSYNENFEITYASNKWTLNIKKGLDKAVLTASEELVIALTATETGNQKVGDAVLIIEIPPERVPKFLDAYYLAEYPENGTGIIEFESPIKFSNVENPSTVQISLDNYEDNFEIVYNSNRWYITIKKPLDQDILYSNPELVMSLIATEAGNENKGVSGLVLKLPTAANGIAPKFSDAYYIAEYPENGTGTINFENPIKFENVDDPAKVTISLDRYADNFEIQYNSGRWYINIKNSLPQPVLHGNVELVMSLIAKELENKYEGQAALILKLPTAASGTTPKFSEAYYVANYPESGKGVIEFEKPISFTNVDDPTGLTINLDNYADNFEVSYSANRWFINIKEGLDENVLHKNVELTMTLVATETGNDNKGQAALILTLPTATTGTAPKFSDAYYIARYPESGTGIIEVDPSISFTNVDDETEVKIDLESYASNFAVAYDSDADRWYININNGLEEAVLTKNSELVITLTATESGIEEKGRSVLILELPDSYGALLEFSEAYYLADYPTDGSEIIEFDTPIRFKSIDDPTSVKISLSDYSANFEVEYGNGRWYMNIISALEQTVINENRELVMTLTASKPDDESKGFSVLILRLPAPAEAPQFFEAYYLAEYPEDESGVIVLKNPITFVNVDDPTTLKITLDNYSDNLEVTYDKEASKWNINIKKALGSSILNENTELVATLIATEPGNINEGHSTLILQLPTAATGTALKFSEAYYIAEYPGNGDGTITFDRPIEFLNVADPQSVTITLENYSENFDINYVSESWLINIKNSLDKSVLSDNAELVTTMIASVATDSDVKHGGRAALILKLPTAINGTAPKFSEAYYVAEYPKINADAIQFDYPIQFINVDDPSSVTIDLGNYNDYFDIKFDSTKWYIQVKKAPEDSIFKETTELVTTLIATEDGKDDKGYSALVLKLPSPEEPPEFSKAYYTAEYRIADDSANIILAEAINIINKDDPSKISITLDSYQENFNIVYDNDKNSWVVNVVKPISDTIASSKTDLVIGLAATDAENELTGYSVIDITLPSMDSETAPKFSKTYYTAKYTISGATSLVTLDQPISITNRQDLSDISISTDNYVENFKIEYTAATNEWKMSVVKDLDESILNAKVDLVMGLTATDKRTNEVGQCALVLTLPVVNNNEAPKFSRIYYSGSYNTDNGGTISVENSIEIINKVDLSKVTVTLDDSYRNNFDVKYNDATSSWTLDVKSPLTGTSLSDNRELILTLTATEIGNDNIGQAALVLELPLDQAKVPPKFTFAHYSAKYLINDGQASITLDNPIAIENKDDLTSISITLDSYTANFKTTHDPDAEDWILSIDQPLPEPILRSNSELVITLVAKEENNDNTGESTLILALPSSQDSTEGAVRFSQIHYSASYDDASASTELTLDEPIKVVTELDTAGLTVSIENEEYAKYFSIEQNAGEYKISVTTPLPEEILNNEISLPLTLVAKVDDNYGYATLVINLPATDRIEFSQPLYGATYQVIDGKGTLEVNGPIEIITEVSTANIHPRLSSNTGYEQYFGVSYSNNILEVLRTKDLPESVLRTVSFIPLILTVGITGTSEEASAVLNVAIEYDEREDLAVVFSSVLYNGNYEVVDGSGVLTTDEITVITEEPDSNINVTISNDEYKEYFNAAYSNKIVRVQKTKDLPNNILRSESFIPLLLTVGITGQTDYSSAVLNVVIDYDEEEEGDVVFSTVLYNGIYEIVDGRGVLTTDEIKVITEEPDNNINASISNDDYKEYFRVVYSNKIVRVEKIKDLPNEILREQSFIPLLLIIGITGATDYSSAVLNVAIDFSDDEDLSIEFSNLLYNGRYEVTAGIGKLTINGDITIISEESDSNIDVIVSNEYAEFFSVSHSNKIVEIGLAKQLPTDILNSSSFVPLTLQASIRGTPYQTSAVLNIKIVYDSDDDPFSIDFTDVLYTAEYSVEGEKGILELNQQITVVTDRPDDEIKATIENSQYSRYFQISYSTNTVSVGLLEDLPHDVVTRNTFIPLILTVSIRGTTHSSAAVLNININIPEDERIAITFSNILYNGKYEVTNGIGVLSVQDKISIETEESDEVIAVIVSNEYAEYFTVSHTDKIVTLTLAKQIPTDVLQSMAFIPITLQALIQGTSSHASAVLNVRIEYDGEEDPGAIDFTSVLYTAEYIVANGKATLNLDGEIKVVTNSTDEEIEVLIDGSAYSKYFRASYSSNTVTIALLEDLPHDVVIENTFIPLTLTVRIRGTTHRSSAVLNININNDEENRTVTFTNILYHGTYEVTDGSVALTIDDDITVVTEAQDSDVKIIVSNEYQAYFSVSVADKIALVTLTKPLPTDVLDSISVIPVTLQAWVQGTLLQSSAVLNLKIVYDGNNDPGAIDFTEVLYRGEYSISDGKGKLELNEEIKVVTDSPDYDVEASITGSEYDKYFRISYAGNTVSIDLIQDLPQEILTKNSFIALALTVAIKGTTHRSSAVLNININIPDNEDDSYITFSTILYHGKYEVIDGTGTLTLDQHILVLTEEPEDNVEVVVSNEYDRYFDASYSENVVSVRLLRQLSTEILEGLSNVPVTLQVSIKGTSHHSSAVLNIKIIYDRDEDPGTIEFSTVLYTADYLVNDGKGQLHSNDTIEVITDRADEEIEASISEDSAYKEYFTISYSDNIVSIELSKSLPQDGLARNSVVTLTLTVAIKGTTHRSWAVLNIRNNDDGEDEDLNTDSKNCDLSHEKTIYISVISVLSVLLLALIISALVIYYLRIRSRSYANLEEEDGRVRFNKNSLKRGESDVRPNSTLEERRPTGFVFNPKNSEFGESSNVRY